MGRKLEGRRLSRSLGVPAALVVLVCAVSLGAATAGTTTYSIAPGGPPLTVTISAPDDDAAVVFTGAAGQRISLKLTGVTIGTSSCCSTLVSILKPDGTTLVPGTFVGRNGGFIDATTLPTAGEYTIRVDPQGTATGGMTLTLYDVPADVSATTVPGGAVTLATTVPGQNARISFNGAASQRISLKLGPTCCSVKASILKPDGTALVAPTTIGTTGGFIDTQTLPVAGTYAIVIDPQSSVTGSVSTTLYNVPADASATMAAGGPAVTLTTTTPGQNAKATFNGTAGRRISLKVASPCCSTRVSILKPDGTSLVAPTSFGTSGGFIDATALPASGTYTIFVDPQSSSVGGVTLTLYDVPGDLAATIVPGGAALTLTLPTPGQNASATFDATAGQRISLDISGVTISSSLVSVSKPDGTNLVSPTSVGTSGAFIDRTTLPVGGTYTISVNPQGSATGAMTLRLYDVPADATAALAPDGVGVTVATTVPGQNALPTFAGTAGQRVSLKVSGVTVGSSPCCGIKVSLLSPGGATVVAPTSFGTSGGFIDTKTLPETGTYAILVDPQGSATGSVTITVHDVPADASATTTPGGPAVTVTTTVPGQNAKVLFDGVAGGRVSVNLSGVTISSSLVSIVNPDGTTLAVPVSFGTLGGFIDTRTLPSTGTYAIVVDPQGAAVGKMTLTVYDVGPDVAATIVPGGPPVTVSMTTPGQNAKLSFTGAAGQRVSLKLGAVTIGTSACCSTNVSILKPDGTALAAPTSIGTSGGFVDTKVLTTSGTYTILVDPVGSAKGNATLTLYDVPADVTGATTPDGPPTTVTTTTPGQNATVTFAGTAGRGVSLRVAWAASQCCLVKVSILRPDGLALMAPVSVGSDGAFFDARMLPVTGTYSIFVDPQAAAVGATTLTLYDVPPDVTAPLTPNGPAVTLTTTTPGQNARFTFPGAVNDAALVTIGPNCCASIVSILKPDGTRLGSAVTFDKPGGTMTARLPVAGTYTILVDVSGQLVGNVSARVSIDNAPPASPVLSIVESSPSSHATGSTFYYRPSGTGATFTVTATTSDVGTGVQKVTFPGLSGGFTPTAAMSDTTAPYSQSYTWATGATLNSTANTVTAQDYAGNTSSSPFAVVRDADAPVTSDDTASIGSSWRNTTQTVTLSASDAAAGVAATYYTTNGTTPTTGSPQGTVVTLSAEGVHTIKYFSVDNVGNTEAVTTASTQIRIDKTSPSSTTTFPGAGGSYNAARWNAGCAGGAGFCGSASDSLSGVQKVELSIRQGAGNYWDGTSFSSAGEVFLTASGSTAWSAAFGAASFPADGSYTLRVRAVDNAGNVQAAASRTFTYDTAPPDTTITSGPANPSNSASASFGFTASEAGSSFQCSLDGGAFAACTSPKSYTGLAAGSHTVQVRAIDAAGNTDPTPAAWTWTIDLTAPDTTITAKPTTPTNQTSASFSFTSTEAGSSFQCSLDAGAFAACASPRSYSGLAAGSHTFQVRAVDTAGNVDPTPASFPWTVDVAPPNTAINSGPASPTNQTSASFSFSSSEGGSSFECSLDGAAFASCSTPQSYGGLAEGAHTFEVRATDAAGNTDATPAARAWTVDLTPPETTVTSGPADPSNSPSASFAFSSSEAGSSFQCSLDGGSFLACTSPKSYSGLAAGSHTFRVRATDVAGNTDLSPDSFTWTVDLTAPDTTISSGPPTATTQTSAAFGFSSSDAGSSFECSLDGAAFASCSSPQSYSGLTEGSHTFEVRAVDTAGNRDPTPASRTWTVDLTAPETSIGSTPADPSGSAAASFGFSSSEAGSSFECSLDGAAFASCSSPQSYSGLAEGAHTFEVRATDAAGNADATPARFAWMVDVTAPPVPLLTSPADGSVNTTGSVLVAGTAEPGSSVEVFDGAGSQGATSADGAGTWSLSLAGVADGVHVYSARATDAAGNTSAASETRTVTVDTVAPDTSIGSAPADPSGSAAASFEFSSSEGGSSFECSLDGAAFASCSSPQGYGGLAQGSHTFEVRATDGAGNTDPTPASRTWTVDLTAPETSIGSAPADPSGSAAASFGFSSSEAGSSFECSLDGSAFASCSSPQSYGGLAEGSHTFEVRATDAAGNTDPTPAGFTWTVDTTAPETTIDSAPTDPTSETTAAFGFHADEPGSTFECSLDAVPFSPCTAPRSYTGLAAGSHSFEVRATDAAGNPDPTPATHTWTVL